MVHAQHKQMKLKEALAIIVSLSKPSKMPCHGWSLPARRCITGAKMAKVEGSICSKCYALRGNYRYETVQDCLERRYQSLQDVRWIDAMSTAINLTETSGYFRWHDSGDLQGVWHLQMIVEVCKRTPHIKHWLPTREYSIVRKYIDEGGQIPDNLTVRLSALMFDGPAPESLAKRLGIQVSGASKTSFSCPASTQGNKCLSCRVCWNKDAFNVSYKQH